MGKPKLTKTRDQHIYSYQDSKGTKKFAYRYRYTHTNGRKLDAYKQNFASATEASLALIAKKAELLTGNLIKTDNKNLTIEQLCKIYTDYKRNQWKSSTYVTNTHALKAICKRMGRTKLSELTKVNYRLKFIEPQLDEIAASTVNFQHRIFNGAVNFAVDEEYIDRNRIRTTKVEYTVKHFALEKTELEQVLRYAKDIKSVMYNTLVTLAYTGMRRGEAAGLKFGDIDFVEKTISIDRTFDHHGERSPKTNNSIRILPLPIVLEKLFTQLKRQRKELLFKKTGKIDGAILNEEFILLNQQGNHLSPATFQHFFSKLLKETGIKCHAHVLRHTYATILIGEGFDVATVANLLGDTIATIQKVYVHAINEHCEKASKRFEDIFFEII